MGCDDVLAAVALAAAGSSVTLYEQYLAARARAEENARMDDLWRLGGFVLSVRNDYARIGNVTGRLDAPMRPALQSDLRLPEIDPVTMTAPGRPRIYRELA